MTYPRFQVGQSKYKFILIGLLVLSSFFNISAQNQIATLPNGKKVVLYSDNTWEYSSGFQYNFDFSTLKRGDIPSFLRNGILVNYTVLKRTVEMYFQGWRYIMPFPKSNQASWGNNDGRTTWWKGYWHNIKTNRYSRVTPDKNSGGYYLGDEQNDNGYYRNGGCPRMPSKIQWLLSTRGGVKPIN